MIGVLLSNGVQDESDHRISVKRKVAVGAVLAQKHAAQVWRRQSVLEHVGLGEAPVPFGLGFDTDNRGRVQIDQREGGREGTS